jgi:CTP synthase (UTP-ammonia lyase)
LRRHVLGLAQAEHEESSPEAEQLVISKLVCSLVGSTETVTILPGTLTHRAYGVTEAAEKFACNYGLNPAYRGQISQGALKISATGPEGEVRAVELAGHPFFVGALFLPQVSSTADRPHPLIVAYLRAALAQRGGQGGRD